jgi:hypothetical protein
MSLQVDELSPLHRAKKLFDSILSTLKRKAKEIDVDELRQRGSDVASTINQKIEDYDVKSKLDTAVDSAKKQANKIGLNEIKAKVADATSKAEADITSKIGKFKRVAREKKERFFAAIKLKLQKVWRVTKWVLFIILLGTLIGTVVGMFLPQGNLVAKSSCYTRGIAYYTAIGSFPTLSTGEDALSKIEGNCARSGGFAFGSDD